MTPAMNRSLAVVTAISAAGVLAGPAPVQIAAGMLLAFALPGLAVTGVLFRGRDLSSVERVLLAPALSLAVLVISGLLMYAAGVDLNRPAWTAATAGVTLLALLGGALPSRHRRAVEQPDAPREEVREPALAAVAARAALAPGTIAIGTSAVPPVAAVPDRAESRPQSAPKSAPESVPAPARPRMLRQLLPLVLAVAVLGGASWLSYTSARDSFETTVTALSAGRPGATTVAGLRDVPVTASGLVPGDGPYRLVVTGENGLVIEQRTVRGTDAASSWTLTLPSRQKVTVALFRASDTQPYRTVLLSPDLPG
jgi:hypothetical protein